MHPRLNTRLDLHSNVGGRQHLPHPTSTPSQLIQGRAWYPRSQGIHIKSNLRFAGVELWG